FKWLKYWTMAKPKPISAVAVRCHDIIVRSTLRRVRIQPKWLSAVALTSNRPAPEALRGSDMRVTLLSDRFRGGSLRTALGMRRTTPATRGAPNDSALVIADEGHSGNRHGSSRCRPAPDDARPGGNGGNNSARINANRPSAPCGES